MASDEDVELSAPLLQDFPCPITLGQWEACDWTGKREEELRVAETERGEAKMEAEEQEEEPEPAWL